MFTSSQIARACGIRRESAAEKLCHIPSAGAVTVRGKRVEGWAFADLPLDWKSEITRRGVKRGFQNGEDFLAKLPEEWKAPVPWADVSPVEQTKAVRLQKALGRALQLRTAGKATPTEIEEAGLVDFAAEFGYKISERHWRRLLHRTLERDAGEYHWQRLEIYLHERAFLRAGTRRSLPSVEWNRADMDEALTVLENRQTPTAADKQFIWNQVFTCYESAVAEFADATHGNRARRAVKASIICYLSNALHGSLAASEKSLRRRFDEKLDLWRTGGRTAEALKDNRDRSGATAKKLCEPCRKNLIGAAVDLDGDISQAWRRLHQAKKFCEICARLWVFNVRSNKSYVPVSLRADVSPLIEQALVWRRGAKHARLASPYVKRDWSKTAPGQFSVCDDMTSDHAVHGRVELPLAFERNERGEVFIGRLEILFSCDERTDYPLAFMAIMGDPATADSPQRKATYNQAHQRMLILRQHDSVGLPHEGFTLENGPWRNRLMDGEGVQHINHWSSLGIAKFENGLGQMGLKIRRAMSGNPRTKMIERFFYALQSRTRCHQGYLGNNERLSKREVVQDFIARAKAGKEDPGNALFSVKQFIDIISQESMAFAEEPQNGDRLPGVSPKEAFYGGIDGHPGYSTKPLRQFASQVRFLLATHEREQRVGPQGIVFKLGKSSIPFWGPELEGLQHKTVLARFNIEEPYLLSVRAEGVEPFVVKAKVMDATTADKEQLAQVARDRASWARHGKVIFDTLPHPFRFTIAKDQEHSEEVREYGATYDHKLGEAKAEVAEKEKSRRSVQRAATAAGVEPRLTERHPGRVSKALQMRQRAELLRAAEGEIKITED